MSCRWPIRSKYEFSTVKAPLLAARELCPIQKISAWRHGQAVDIYKPLEKIAHDIMDRQAISVILKNLFPLYPPVFTWGFLDLLKSKTRQSPQIIQPTRQSPIMYNHDPIYTQCKYQINSTCTTSFLRTPYEWQTTVGSAILAAHTVKTSICHLLCVLQVVGRTLAHIFTTKSTPTIEMFASMSFCTYP